MAATLGVNVLKTDTNDGVPDDAFLHRAAVTAAAAAEADQAGFSGPREVAISIVAVDESQARNAQWRDKDTPTNVLAFPAPDMPGPPGAPVPAGDIVICAEIVSREARDQGKAPAAHWAHMVVHGTLHLMGYDHIEEEDAAVMEAAERRALAALGFEDPYAVHDT